MRIFNYLYVTTLSMDWIYKCLPAVFPQGFRVDTIKSTRTNHLSVCGHVTAIVVKPSEFKPIHHIIAIIIV